MNVTPNRMACRCWPGGFIFVLCLTQVACRAGAVRTAVDSDGASPRREPGWSEEWTATAAGKEGRPPPTFPRWVEACSRLPSNRSLKGRPPPRSVLPLKTFEPVETAFQRFFEQSARGPFADRALWVGPGPAQPGVPAAGLTGASRFRPFGQKLTLPPGACVFFHGDLHGDIHSMVAYLSWLNREGVLTGFKVTDGRSYLMFLGDYTDRGVYGVEVIYTLLRLKLANPGRVFLVRGNHEDASLIARYGFIQEGVAKYGAHFKPAAILRFYDRLPAVIYLGCEPDFLQCNHGGLEPGYNPCALLEAPGTVRFQLLGRLDQRRFWQSHPGALRRFDPTSRALLRRLSRDFLPESPVRPFVIGFLWNDFSILSQDPAVRYNPGRAWVFGQAATEIVLAAASSASHRLRGVFRAHQHAAARTPMMRRLLASNGVFRHWQEDDPGLEAGRETGTLKAHLETSKERRLIDGGVYTFNVVPDSVYGEACGFTFDTAGKLRIAQGFENWRLEVIQLMPSSP